MKNKNCSPGSSEKIAVVVQRFGEGIVGGAESLALDLVSRLVEARGYHVDVYTSAARDYRSWKNELPLKEVWGDSIEVFRFPSLIQRRQRVFNAYSRVFFRLQRLRRWLPKKMYALLEKVYFILQGPWCPGLVKTLEKNVQNYEKIMLFTYLYYPTIEASKIDPSKCIMIPTTHDEPPFYTDSVRETFNRVPQIFALTIPECEFIDRTLNIGAKVEVAGYGIDMREDLLVDSEKPLLDSRYLLYLGRISFAKGVQNLIDYFMRIKLKDPSLQLVFAGHLEADVEIPDSESIVYLGYVSDENKDNLIRNAVAVVNPSGFESLSMIALEAMALLTPVVLNSHSEVLRHYVESTPTAFGYLCFEDFEKAIELLTKEDFKGGSRNLLLETRSWVQQQFSWDCVIRKYHQALSG